MMTLNGAELHLAINHFPVIGFFLTALFLAIGLARNNEQIKEFSLAFFVFFALVAIPAYLTGDPAAKVVRHLPDTNKLMVANHSQAAFLALILMEVLGAGSILLLVTRKNKH